jgi:hypothetical protein
MKKIQNKSMFNKVLYPQNSPDLRQPFPRFSQLKSLMSKFVRFTNYIYSSIRIRVVYSYSN